MSLNAGNYILFFKMSLILVVKINCDGLYYFLFLKNGALTRNYRLAQHFNCDAFSRLRCNKLPIRIRFDSQPIDG